MKICTFRQNYEVNFNKSDACDINRWKRMMLRATEKATGVYWMYRSRGFNCEASGILHFFTCFIEAPFLNGSCFVSIFFLESVIWFPIHSVVCIARTKIANKYTAKTFPGDGFSSTMKKHENIFNVTRALWIMTIPPQFTYVHTWRKRIAPTHSMDTPMAFQRQKAT